MIHFMIGRAGRKQSEPIYRTVRSLPENEKAFLIVPDQFTYETERKILEKKKAELKTEVLSLKRLAYRMESLFADEKINILSREASAMLIKRAVDLCAEELSIFRAVSRKQGFCEEVMEFIDEIKKGDLMPEDLVIHPEDTENVRGKIKDIKLIYEKYLSLIPEGFMTADDYFSVISEKCSNLSLIKDSHFYFDGFYSFDKSEYPLISLIMRNAKSVTFSFITDNEKYFDCSQYTLRELYEIINEYSLEYSVDKNNDTSLLSEEGIFLEENLMSYDKVAFSEDTNRINLIEANDIYDECDYVACEINRLIRQEDMRYSDFQVICTDKSYFSYLRNSFSMHGIEHFIDENKDISSTSAVRAFLYIIDMLDNSYTTTELISFAKSGFSDLCDDEYMLLENYVLEMGIKGKMWESDFLKNNAEESYDMDLINSIREKLISPIKNIRKNILGYENVSEFTRLLINSLEEISFEQRLDEYICGFINEGDHESANIYSQLNNKILAVLSELENFFGCEYLSPKELYDLLSFCLSSCNVGVIPSRIDAVNVGDVIRSGNKNCKVMFIMGCREGLMPSADVSRPVLNDRERTSLKGFSLKNTGEYLRSRENFVYYTFICSAKEKLYLSYAKDEEDVYPSVMFERIKEIFPYSNFPDVSEELCRENMIDTKDYAFYKMAGMISESGREPLSGYALSAISAIKDSLDDEMTKSYIKIITDGSSFDNDSGIQNKQVYSSAVPRPLVTSVSMLESYGRCPFLFFMDYVLKPQKRRIRKVKNTDIGSILHKIVEEISDMIISEKFDIYSSTDEDISDVVRIVTDNTLSSYKDGIVLGVTHGKYLYRKLLTSAISAVKELVAQLKHSDFVLSESEAPFGPKGKYDAVELNTKENEKVLIRGIIDRIDYASVLGGKYLKIVDYKSSKRTFDLSKTMGKISFQLPAYAMAVKDEGSDVAGVYYFKLNSTPVPIDKQMSIEEIEEKVRKERKLNGLTLKDMDVVLSLDTGAEDDSFIANVSIKKDKTFSDREGLYTKEEFSSLMEMTRENMLVVSEDIMDGNIPVTPYRFGQNENACTYCEYGEICKFSPSFEKNSFRNIEKMTKNDLAKEHTHG